MRGWVDEWMNKWVGGWEKIAYLADPHPCVDGGEEVGGWVDGGFPGQGRCCFFVAFDDEVVEKETV